MSWSWLRLAAFPVVLTVGILLIPVVEDYSDHEAATRLLSEAPVRWAMGHLVAAAAFGLAVLTAGSVVGAIRSDARRRRASFALWFMGLGAALHAAGLGADGVGPIAALWAGADPQTFFDGSASLIPPLFIGGAVLFGVGQITVIVQVVKDGRLAGSRAELALVTAVFFSLCEALPTGWGLYGVAACSLALYLPMIGQLGSPTGTSLTS